MITNINTAYGIICIANDSIKTGGITGFMASCVADMVIKCHSRGEEFRKSHNGEAVIDSKGTKANDVEGTVVNHACLTIGEKE